MMIDQFRSIGGDLDLLTPVLGVAKPYLAAGITEMQSKFGTIEGYFSEGLGLDAATIIGKAQRMYDARQFTMATPGSSRWPRSPPSCGVTPMTIYRHIRTDSLTVGSLTVGPTHLDQDRQ